jgi:hypothetical protein
MDGFATPHGRLRMPYGHFRGLEAQRKILLLLRIFQKSCLTATNPIFSFLQNDLADEDR